MIRIALITALHFIQYGYSYGQLATGNKRETLSVAILNKKPIRNGDTLFISIKNNDLADRGFTIEASSSNKNPYYYNAVYTAFLNNDSVFFRKLQAAQQGSRKEKIKYILPDYQLLPHRIKAGEEQILFFIMQGLPLKKSIPVRLNIETDIKAGTSETVSIQPLAIFFLPR